MLTRNIFDYLFTKSFNYNGISYQGKEGAIKYIQAINHWTEDECIKLIHDTLKEDYDKLAEHIKINFINKNLSEEECLFEIQKITLWGIITCKIFYYTKCKNK